MKILLTAFGPFGGDAVNASLDVLHAVERGWSGPAELATAVLPVTFAGAPAALCDAIDAERPDSLVCLGEAGGRDAITPERWAHVIADARIPDNDGGQPSRRPLDDGPERLESRIPVEGLVEAVEAVGVRAEPSEDAGRFVCNATFRAALTSFDGPVAFLHVPAIRPRGETAGVGEETDGERPRWAATMTVEEAAAGVTAALETLA